MKNEFTSLMIKKELKEMMDKKIKEIGIEMSYSALIKYLIKNNNVNLQPLCSYTNRYIKKNNINYENKT